MGGMKNVLHAMSKVGARKICFTDSIGSFGVKLYNTKPRNSIFDLSCMYRCCTF